MPGKKVESDINDITENKKVKEAGNELKETKKKTATKKTSTTKKTTGTKKATTAKKVASSKKENTDKENVEGKKKTASKKSTTAKKSATTKKAATTTKKKIDTEKKEPLPLEEKENKIKKETLAQIEEKVETPIEEEQEEKKVAKKEQWISLKEIKKSITAKNNLPKEENEKINRHLFQNIMVAIVIIIYFIFLNLGKNNIQGNVFVTDLKVFGMCIMLLAIALMEKAYKEDSGRIAVFAIEMIVLSLTTVSLIYIDLIFSTRFEFIVTAISYIFAIYYLIKSIIIYLKKRKKYFVDDMKEIIKDKEEE